MVNEEFIMASATNGYLVIWKISWIEWEKIQLVQILSHGVHQSSIKSLDLLHVGSVRDVDGFSLVATGGDDNSIAITRMSPVPAALGGAIISFMCWSTHISRAHAAAVTAVKWIHGAALVKGIQDRTLHGNNNPEGPANIAKVFLLSASNDQTVRLWGLDFWACSCSWYTHEANEAHEVDVSRYGKFPSEIADISSIDLMCDNGWKAIIAGVGVEAWDIQGA
jgi:WD40 repeat protein